MLNTLYTTAMILLGIALVIYLLPIFIKRNSVSFKGFTHQIALRITIIVWIIILFYFVVKYLN